MGRVRSAAAGLLALALALACAAPHAVPEPDPLEPLRARVSELRGLPFLERVHLERVDVDDVRRLLQREVDSLYPPDQLEAYEAAYRSLGVLPPGLDLLEALLSLQSQELAGLYVARQKTMFVLREFAMGDEEGSLIVLHELVHALQDQHFPGALELLEDLRHDDDLVTAIAAVLEGDASLVTLYGHGSAEPRDVAIAEQMRDQMLRELREPSPAASEVPLLLRASLMFPYAYGTVLAARAFTAGGNPALNREIDDPPLSSRDLLAGSREPVEFVVLPLDEIERDAKASHCELGHNNVAGSLTLQVLFQAHGAPVPDELLEGWRGDRFLHLRCREGSELLFVSRWSTPAVAVEFARSYQKIAESAARWSEQAAPARARVHGRDVVIATPLVEPLAPRWLVRTHFERTASLTEWLLEGCAGESECPTPSPRRAQAPGG
jgi:hypothetical protein